MEITFEEVAVRSNVWARVLFMGPTGSGKSRGAFELATRLFGGELKVTYINTERDREKLYADRYTYSLIDLTKAGDYSPDTFIGALDLAEARNPGGVYIIDSVSHEWVGSGGVLSMADRFGDWKTVRPKHNAFVDRLLACDAHVIAVCRAKMKYEVGEEEVGGRKRQTITMLGVGPVQSDDLQYEFNLVGRFEQATHRAAFSGHVDPLIDTDADMVDGGQAVADTYSRWLSEGEPIFPVESAGEAEIEELRQSLLAEGITEEVITDKFSVARKGNRGKLAPSYVAEQYTKSQQRLERKAAAAKKPAAEPGGGAQEPAKAESAGEGAKQEQESLTPA